MLTTADPIPEYRRWKNFVIMDNVKIKVIFEVLYSFHHCTKTTDELQKHWAQSVLSNQHMQMFPHEWSDREDRRRPTDADTDPDSDIDTDTAIPDAQGLTHPKANVINAETWPVPSTLQPNNLSPSDTINAALLISSSSKWFPNKNFARFCSLLLMTLSPKVTFCTSSSSSASPSYSFFFFFSFSYLSSSSSSSSCQSSDLSNSSYFISVSYVRWYPQNSW